VYKPIVLQIVSWGSLDLEPAWLVETLVRAQGVVAVNFAPYALFRAPPCAWDWPLDVAFLDDDLSQSLKHAIQGLHWSRFVRLVDASKAGAQIDLLLVPGTLGEAFAAVSNAPRLAETHTVLALGGAGRTRDVPASLNALRAEAGAAASGVVEVPLDKAQRWLDNVLLVLSHDAALDEALFSSAKAFGTPILLSPWNALPSARASRAAMHFARTLSRAALPEWRRKEAFVPAVPPRLVSRLGLRTDAPLDEIASSLEQGAEALDWHSEVEAATDIVELAGGVEEAQHDGRYLQARVYVADRLLGDEPLVPGELHRLEVRIARPAEDWAIAPARFPEDKLPPDQRGHELQVVLVAPGVLSEPQNATLWLPAYDDSEPAAFHFPVPGALNRIDARVTILHENRILQTLRISAGVGTRSSAGSSLSITLESVLRARFDALSGGAGFDAAVLLNDIDGAAGITAFAGSKTAFIRIQSVDKLVKALRDELEKITKSPNEYLNPASDATRLLLVTLARAGASFLVGLLELPRVKAALGGLGDAPGRLQVVSIHPDDLIPLELVYDRPFPDTQAGLCPGLLGTGPCGVGCARDEKVVCAQGFWGLRHIIERRLYNETEAEELQRQGADYAISPEAGEGRATLSPLQNALFGCADRAANFDRPSFETTMKEIDKLLHGAKVNYSSASVWNTWVEQVKEVHPELLVLLPHTEPELGAAILEIGNNAHIAAGQILGPYVSEPPPAPPRPGPIVMLLGCRTGLNDVPFSSFIGAFRRAKASVIVATMSTVRGRHMAPVAREAIDALVRCGAGPRTSVGEMIRNLRRRLVGKGLPVGLTLVAFGEVDWEIGGP
jgi:hypothetical protein